MNLRMATADDIENLVKIRFDYFAAEAFTVSAEEKECIAAQLYDYFNNHLQIDFFAALIEIDATLASTAFLAIAEKPANLSFPTGKTGTILNVFTYPPYQKRGYATKALQLLIAKAKQQNLSYLELSASKKGKPLYQKLGFAERDFAKAFTTEMRMSLL